MNPWAERSITTLTLRHCGRPENLTFELDKQLNAHNGQARELRPICYNACPCGRAEMNRWKDRLGMVYVALPSRSIVEYHRWRTSCRRVERDRALVAMFPWLQLVNRDRNRIAMDAWCHNRRQFLLERSTFGCFRRRKIECCVAFSRRQMSIWATLDCDRHLRAKNSWSQFHIKTSIGTSTGVVDLLHFIVQDFLECSIIYSGSIKDTFIW